MKIKKFGYDGIILRLALASMWLVALAISASGMWLWFWLGLRFIGFLTVIAGLTISTLAIDEYQFISSKWH